MLSEEGEESRAQHARLLQDVEGPEGDNNELSYMRGVSRWGVPRPRLCVIQNSQLQARKYFIQFSEI